MTLLTERLYNEDSHRKEFRAVVAACEKQRIPGASALTEPLSFRRAADKAAIPGF